MTTAIHTYLRAQRHQIDDLMEFYECKQEEGETFDSLLCVLREIAANCDLDKMTVDRHFVIRIITRIPDPNIHWKLIAKPDLDHKTENVTCRQEDVRLGL